MMNQHMRFRIIKRKDGTREPIARIFLGDRSTSAYVPLIKPSGKWTTKRPKTMLVKDWQVYLKFKSIDDDKPF